MLGRRHGVACVALLLVLGAGCGDDDAPAAEPGTYRIADDEAEQHETAYVAAVVADPPGDDLAEGAGEHVVIANNADIRIDMGGWWLDVGSQRLDLGIGRQIDPGAELRVHPGPGTTDDDAVFLDLGAEVLHDERGVVVLRDAAGDAVARFRYSDAQD